MKNMMFALLLVLVGAAQADTSVPQSKASQVKASATQLQQKDVQLAELVAKALPANPKDDMHIAIKPYLVRFNAKLLEGPRPQKADSLLSGLSMMGMSPLPKVSHRIVLGFVDANGKPQHVVAYIEDGAAKLAQSLKVGDRLQFSAIHAYNYVRGPGLLVMAFGSPK